MNIVENEAWKTNTGSFKDCVYKLARWVLKEGEVKRILSKTENNKIIGIDDVALSAEHHGLYLINMVTKKGKVEKNYLELLFNKEDGTHLRYAVDLNNFEDIVNEENVVIVKKGNKILETPIGQGLAITDKNTPANKRIFMNMAKKVI